MLYRELKLQKFRQNKDSDEIFDIVVPYGVKTRIYQCALKWTELNRIV